MLNYIYVFMYVCMYPKLLEEIDMEKKKKNESVKSKRIKNFSSEEVDMEKKKEVDMEKKMEPIMLN